MIKVRVILVIVALWPLLVAAQSERSTHIAIGGYMVGQFTDIATTEFCIGRGTCSEANPLMRWAEHRPVAMATVKGTVATLSSYLLIRLHTKAPRATFWTTIGLAAGQAWLTYHNMKVAGR